MPGPPFKNVINTGTKDNNQLTSELLRSIVSGKLIISYNSVVDINWLKQQHMLNMLGLDLTNFAKTAKFSYMACKRLMNLNMNSQQSCFQLYFKTEKSWFFHGEGTSHYIITFHQADSKVSILSCNLFVKVIKNKSK